MPIDDETRKRLHDMADDMQVMKVQQTTMSNTLNHVEALGKTTTAILTGNGDPKNGIIVRFEKVELDHQRIIKGMIWIFAAVVMIALGMVKVRMFG